MRNIYDSMMDGISEEPFKSKALPIEKLLKPRYKVIALWPFEPENSIGSIYHEPIQKRGGQWTEIWRWWDEMSKHPHLFKKLEWCEEREESDMPEYFKVNLDGSYCLGQVFKIDKVLPLSMKFVFNDGLNRYSYIHFKHTLPATKEEFLTQQNKNHV